MENKIKQKIKGLVLLSKDVDAYLSNYLVKKRGFYIDVVTFRHRDKLEIEKKFPDTFKIKSLSEYYKNNKSKYQQYSISDLAILISKYETAYSLRTANRYVHYDLFRSRPLKYTHKENLLLNLIIIEFFLELELNKYEFLLGELSRSFYLIAYDLAHFFSVEYLHPINPGFFDGIFFVDDNFKIPYLEKRAAILSSNAKEFDRYKNEATKKFDKFSENPVYNKDFLGNNLRYIALQIKTLPQKILNLQYEFQAIKIDYKHSMSYVYKNPISRFIQPSVIRYLKSKFLSIFLRDEIKGLDQYVYYPLHVHPETTTSLFSERTIETFNPQRSTIEFASKILPTGLSLVIKEHPAMIGNRSLGFYLGLKKIYNTKLMNPKTNQFDLIKNSKFIITHCGTVGIEAICLKKPVILLEGAYYDFLDGVIKVECTSNLPQAFESAKFYQFNSKRLVNSLSLLLFSTYAGVKNFIREHDYTVIGEKNLANFSDAICTELVFRKEAKLVNAISLERFKDM